MHYHLTDQCTIATGFKAGSPRARWLPISDRIQPSISITQMLHGEIIATSLRPKPGIMVNKGNHPQMALIQVSENLIIYPDVWYIYCTITG